MHATVRVILDCARIKRLSIAILLLAWGIPSAYCQENLQTPAQTNARIQELAAIAAQTHPTNIPVGSGDVLHIDVFDVPDLSRDVRVSQDGQISLPLIPGKIQVGGLTTFQVEEKLEELLQVNGLVSHPHVSIFVKEQNSQPVSVVGAVNKPTVYQIIRPTTLLEILSQAGGIADDAGSVVIITRSVVPAAESSKQGAATEPAPSAPQTQTITIDLRDLLESGDPAFNIAVYGGDIISVPKAGIVYVAGAVQQPGGFVLQNAGDQMSTLKAVALAHGTLSTAKLTQAVIIRRDSVTGQKKEINVDLKKVMDRKSEDPRMYANDILFVPDSTGKRAFYKTGEAALAITSGLVILRAGR